jgi:thiosulfate/3-mercaptopyruvate sulfurtransferase
VTATYLHPESIVTTDWLSNHLRDVELRIFDCTTYLDPPQAGVAAPYTVRSGLADHQAAHIPGAGFLDLQAELSDNSSPAHLRFTMPSAAALAHALEQRGIGNDSRVILYSRKNMQWATRVWWMLRAIGVDNAAVLDGGFDKWKREGRLTDQSEVAHAPGTISVQPRPELFADANAVEAARSDAKTCTINALSGDLHSGATSRYGRAGRIPGSVNLPALDLQNATDRSFAKPEQAAALFASIGAQAQGPNIVYCGGGIAATLDAFLMFQLGYQNVSVYDASMSEWAKDSSRPIEVD